MYSASAGFTLRPESGSQQLLVSLCVHSAIVLSMRLLQAEVQAQAATSRQTVDAAKRELQEACHTKRCLEGQLDASQQRLESELRTATELTSTVSALQRQLTEQRSVAASASTEAVRRLAAVEAAAEAAAAAAASDLQQYQQQIAAERCRLKDVEQQLTAALDTTSEDAAAELRHATLQQQLSTLQSQLSTTQEKLNAQCALHAEQQGISQCALDTSTAQLEEIRQTTGASVEAATSRLQTALQKIAVAKGEASTRRRNAEDVEQRLHKAMADVSKAEAAFAEEQAARCQLAQETDDVLHAAAQRQAQLRQQVTHVVTHCLALSVCSSNPT